MNTSHQIRCRSLPLLIVLFAILLASPSHAADFFFHDGDRVVFLGDSITEQRLYTTYIEAYTLARFPQWKLTFRNSGWSGDTSWLRYRHQTDENVLFATNDVAQQQMVETAVRDGLERDVLPLHPTAVTIDFGMNDHSYQAFRPDICRAYVRSETELAKVLSQHGARVALLTTQPIEDHRPDPQNDARNQSLRKFGDALKGVATNTGAVFVDQFDPYMTAMLHERAANPAAYIGGGDAVHPGPPGHTIMAWAILKGLGAPSLVSSAVIDAAHGTVTSAAGCTITNLKVMGDNVGFDRLDQALPMPVDANAVPSFRIVPVLEDLSRYELEVSGLKAPSYTLTIDDVAAGTFTRDQLATGCNLTGVPGPITEQARTILKLVFDKNNVYYDRWRKVQLYKLPDWLRSPDFEQQKAAELARLDRKIADFETQIDVARQLKPHRFELKPTEKP
ncbi:MAG TPA: SGNH/GDSL hydrolase family protein [Verrucomicrobiae bacterium]|nr:SGNH/GDSL hydrolase family protein [Verrucomicrobiae bacterium]